MKKIETRIKVRKKVRKGREELLSYTPQYRILQTNWFYKPLLGESWVNIREEHYCKKSAERQVRDELVAYRKLQEERVVEETVTYYNYP